MRQRTATGKWLVGVAVFVVAHLCAQSSLADAIPPASRPVALKAARLFDSVSGKLIEHGVVIVAGTKIQAVGSDLKIPDDAQVIDLGDATLLPGFIDAHVHLSHEAGAEWYRDWFNRIMRFPAEQALYGAHYAKATLEAGITTVRDLGSTDYIALGMRNAINAGEIPGPRMLVSNYAIGSTGGHADQSPVPPQRIAVAGPILGVCSGPDECRAAVRYQIKYGADVIKFMPSGGVLSLSDPVDNVQLTQEEMNAIVSEAHGWSRKVLMAGTANGADLLGLADQTGTLTAGKSADIVAVAGNPLTDMQATEHPVFVMKEGTIYVGARGAAAPL
jgi:imidazolonepropionase-like amidohydrolase